MDDTIVSQTLLRTPAAERRRASRVAAPAAVRRPAACTEKYCTLWSSTLGAASGFADALRCENKIRQVFLSLIGCTIAGVAAGVGFYPLLFVMFTWLVAMICETFNTALEKTLDYACKNEFHPLVKQGKDYASACTFVSVLFASFSTLAVLWDRFF